jgi:membrane-associated phospholipid phosphatase
MRPSERLGAAFLVALAAVSALGRAPGAALLAAAFLALAGGVVLLSRTDGRGPAWCFARDLSPVPLVVAMFLLLEPVIEAANPARWDAALAAFDARHLAALVDAWRGVLGRPPALVDAAYVAYVSYYFLPVGVALAVRSRRREAYEPSVFAIVLTFYLSYLGYFLFPASGPRVPQAEEAAVVGGGAVSEAIRAFLRVAERTPLDAFPSGHTAVSLVSAAVGARALPRLGPALLAWAAAIVFTTVYVHVHYATDVLAGALLGAVALAATPAVSRAVSRLGGAPSAEPGA